MYELFIGNKNYSSWSLRPWVLMRELGIAFDEKLVFFEPNGSPSFRTFSPSGRVPALREGDITVWDSLAIAEYLAEKHPQVWPEAKAARAWARSAAAEMHSGFTALRQTCSMSCGVRVKLFEVAEPLKRDVQRLSELWNDGFKRFGGPFLTGPRFTAADAFFAPVAFRFQSYGLTSDASSMEYVARLRKLPSMVRWYESALAETARDPAHEVETKNIGTVVEDLRASAH
jgi:glutathione S-transferase